MQAVVLFVMGASLLVFMLGMATLMIGEGHPLSREEVTAYECGFEHTSHSRLPFSFRYFLLTMIFLVFDMEIVFLLFLPESLILFSSSVVIVLYAMVFLLLLTLGLFYEWSDGSLDWVM